MRRTTSVGLLIGAAALAALGCNGHAGARRAPAGASQATVTYSPPPAAPAPVAEAQDLEEPGELDLAADEELEPQAEEVAAATAGVVEPATLLHESLEAYESAGAFREQGAVDDALGALDHAYELMARIPAAAIESDPELAQEKENLRILISRRVVEIYAARQSAVGNPDGSVPRVVNADVEFEIKSFQGRERDFFLESYRRSGLYRDRIVEQLHQAGMPEQLSWLPLVESGFKDRAYSRARALGLWQFIPSTGHIYGLDRNDWVDERMDPDKATGAAIRYLSALHDLFGDWLTALAAYNCGERNVLRQINNQKVSYFDQFWDLYQRLPRETRRYVPRFLATLEILDDPAKYGFELPEPYAPLTWETISIERPVQLKTLDKTLGLVEGTLQHLNPELRRDATPRSSYDLKVPPETGATLLAALPGLPAWTPPAVTTSDHRVRSGETLSAIAARYGTSVSAIMSVNRLRSANRLSVGQRLRIPTRGGSGGGSVGSPRAVDGVYVVRRGDTLGAIASRERVPLSKLLAVNRLNSRSTIYPGQRLTIPN